MSGHVVIVGGGVTGLATARALEVDASLFERDGSFGGCLHTDRVGDYHIDRTGHLLHFRDPYVRRLMFEELNIDWLHFDRRAEIHICDRRVPYPIQYNLHALPEETRKRCIDDFMALPSTNPDPLGSFADWSRTAYGQGLHELFFEPYNRKLWQVDLAGMNAEWTTRFVPLPDRDVVIAGASAPHSDAGFGYNASFSYPKRGGSGAIIGALTEGVRAELRSGEALVAVDTDARVCTFASGRRVRYEVLVSTIPLPALIACLHRADPQIAELAAGLRHNSVYYVALGFRVPAPPVLPHWTYVPEARYGMYRIGNLGAYAPGIAPEGHILLCAEIGCPGATAKTMDTSRTVDRVLEEMSEMGMIAPDWKLDMVHTGAIDCAYVVFDQHRRQALPRIRSYLETLGILSVGRYGAWDYGSIGDAVIEARDTAARVHDLVAHRGRR